MKKKPSDVWYAACIAAEKELPAESRAKIDHYDLLAREYSKQGNPDPVWPEIVTARETIDADPLAVIAFELRRNGNKAKCDEFAQSRQNA